MGSRTLRGIALDTLVKQQLPTLAWGTRGHSHNIFNVIYHPCDDVIVTGADDGLLKAWSTRGNIF
jgi:WD40 repeat protein